MPEFRPFTAVRYPAAGDCRADVWSKIAPRYSLLNQPPKRQFLAGDEDNFGSVDLPVK